MKLFVLFAPKFQRWPLALIEYMRQELPDLICTGLVTGGKEIHRAIVDNSVSRDSIIEDLEQLEAVWLRTEVTEAAKKRIFSVFSEQDLKRIIVSDRNIGRRYVSGGVSAETPLMLACDKDVYLERYVYNLCLWAISRWTQEHFDSVLCYAVAGAPAMTLALLCARTGIPFVRLVNSRVGSGLIVDSSQEGLFTSILHKFKYYLGNSDVADENTDFANRYLNSFSNSPERPGYAVKNSERITRELSFSQLIRSCAADTYNAILGRKRTDYLRHPYAVTRIAYNFTTRLTAVRLAHSWPYDRVEEIGEARYVYYPLHVDPEASTMVLAPMFTNQLMVLEALSKSLPIGMKLVVKEHLPMLGKRPRGFYNSIRRLPGVVLVSPLEDNFDLIKKASLVSVITGTAAWEALLLGRPALVFGDVPFACISLGFVRCSDISQLPQKLNEALTVPPAPRNRLIAYLAAIHSESINLDVWNMDPEDLEAAERDKILKKLALKVIEVNTASRATTAPSGYVTL